MDERKHKTVNIINEKLLTNDDCRRRVNARIFIAQSCELAKTLEPRKRIMFLMKYDHGYTNADIAKLCGCSVSKVNRAMDGITKDINEKREMMSEGDETGQGLGRGNGEGQG